MPYSYTLDMVQDAFQGRMPFTGRRKPTLSLGRLAIGLLVPFGMKSTSKSTKLSRVVKKIAPFSNFSPKQIGMFGMLKCGYSQKKSKDGPFTIACGDDWKFSDRSAER